MYLINKIHIYIIVILALMLRLVFLYFMPDLFFPDSKTYMESGEQLFSTGEIIAHNVMPLHPIIVGILNDFMLIKLFNILISSLSVFVLYKLVLEVFGKKEYALLSSLMMAIYPFLMFYSITSLTETLYVFLILAFFFFLYKEKIFFASVLIVLSILLRPTLDIFAPILIFIFSYYVHRSGLKKSLGNILKYFIVYILLMFPWWLHQYHKYGQFVRLNLGDGVVLYSGNNVINKSGGGVSNSEKGKDMDISIFSNIKDPVERNNAMKQSAYDFIVNNPQRFIELAGLKFIRFWRLWPYAYEYEKPIYIVMSLLSYGVVLLLSLVFLFKYMAVHFIRLLPILSLIVYFSAVHMVLIGSIRYRLPIEPFLIMFSSVVVVNYMKYKYKNIFHSL